MAKTTTKLPAQAPRPAPLPVEQPPPAPTLATLLLATIERWRQENGLTQEQFQDELETVWQSWQQD